MNSILERIKASQHDNPVLNKLADGGPITEQSEKSAELATDMIQGAENIPDVTEDVNTAPAAEIGKNADETSNEVTPAVPTSPNEENPDVQEILDAAETIVKTANALFPVAQAFSQLPLEDIEAMFDKQASASSMSDEQIVDFIDKLASNGNPVARSFVDYCNGYAMMMQKIANDTEALVAQGIDPETAEAMAVQAAAGEIPAETAEAVEDVPAEVAADAGAELEAAVSEVIAEAAKEIMEVVPEASPEEAQQLAEELVVNKLTEEMAMMEGSEGMEQTASAEEVPVEAEEAVEEAAEEAVEEVPAKAEENIEGDIAEAIDELTIEAAKEIMEVVPEASPEEAIELASELVSAKLAEELNAEGMEQTASAEETTEEVVEEVPNEAVAEAEEVIAELINETAAEIKAVMPEVSDEEAMQLAEKAVVDAAETAQEQAAIGATDENGEYLVPDEVAAESIEDMVKTASANPLRDALTPVVATLFGIDQTNFINRISK